MAFPTIYCRGHGAENDVALLVFEGLHKLFVHSRCILLVMIFPRKAGMFCKAIADLVGIRFDSLGGLTQCHFSVYQFFSGAIGLVSVHYPWQRFSEFAVMLQFRVSCDAPPNSGTC